MRGNFKRVAAVSLIVTYVFFLEYLPPLRRVHIPYDLEGFNFPLFDQAFQSLHAGRFPQWDATMYCGISFAGNVQATLFYPPTWLMFAVNAGRPRLSYQSVEILVVAHIWVAFLVCYLWLRGRRLQMLPSVLGAGVFAYGGFTMLHLQHFGVLAGYTWIPLGLWGIDEAAESGNWRSLWRLLLASALAFLGGYTPSWFVFCVCVLAYAAASRRGWRTVLWSGGAIAASLMVVMVQLLPAWEAAQHMLPEVNYGGGIRRLEFYVAYFLPNYFDFGIDVDPLTNLGGEYLYLGAPAFFGLACLIRRRPLRGQLAPLAMSAAAAVVLTNAFGAVSAIVEHSRWLIRICRDWYFLAGVTPAVAALAAAGLDDFLRKDKPVAAPRWPALGIMLVSAAWCARQVWVWLPGGRDFAAGWRAALEPAVMLALFAVSLRTLRTQKGALRSCLIATMLFTVAVDYKVFGTSKRFDARPGNWDFEHRSGLLRGLDRNVYDQIRISRNYRIALDTTVPLTELRQCDLRTPQGFDPLLPEQYRKKMGSLARFETNRIFYPDAGKPEILRELGVRYFISSEGATEFAKLSGNPSYRLLEPSGSFYKAFEVSSPIPPYRWAPGTTDSDPIQSTGWSPEHRRFAVRSRNGGRFVLIEQFLPGWEARIDRKTAVIERWDGVFQSIQAPAGEHTVEFIYRAPGLRLGAVITVVSLVGLVALFRRR
jgi:hypothetical protein